MSRHNITSRHRTTISRDTMNRDTTSSDQTFGTEARARCFPATRRASWWTLRYLMGRMRSRLRCCDEIRLIRLHRDARSSALKRRRVAVESVSPLDEVLHVGSVGVASVVLPPSQLAG